LDVQPSLVQEFESIAGNLTPGTSVVAHVLSDATTKLKFQLIASDTNALFRLNDPSGNVIDTVTARSNTNVQSSAVVATNLMLANYEIAAPAQGAWTAVMDGSGVTSTQAIYTLMVSGDSDVAMLPQTASVFNRGEDAVISCALLDLSTNPPTPVPNASISATILCPDGSTNRLVLLDDGAHNDGAAGDGVFAAVLASVQQPGQYSISYRALGTNSLGQALQRVAAGTFTVSFGNGSLLGDPIYEPIDTNGDGVPDLVNVECWVNVQTAGVYVVSCDLVDSTGTNRLSRSAQLSASASGPALVSLIFDLGEIPSLAGSVNLRIENLKLFEMGSGGPVWLDSYHGSSTITLSLTPAAPTITSTNTLPMGTVAVPYSTTLRASGGATPYTWSVAGGSLPPGLGLSTSGTISGVPTAAVSDTFSVKVAGSNGLSSTNGLSLVINPAPPVADFSADPTNGASPLVVDFTDASTGMITNRLWSFGDGGTSDQASPTHAYASAGVFSVSLLVAGPGGSNSLTRSNLVTVTNIPIQIYSVSTASSPSAGGATSGGGSFTNGAPVTVRATASPGYAFINWTENGVQVSTSANYTFSVTANRVLVANFASVYTVVASASPATGGSASGGGIFISGSSVTVSATASPRYVFVNWTEGGATVSILASYTFAATANRTLTANFAALYTVTTSAFPAAAGSISGGGTYTNGTLVLLDATATPGYHFLDWTENGAVLTNSNPLSISVVTNRGLVANFATNLTDSITVSASPSGGGRVSGGGTFKAGSSRTVTATASAGYIFANWTENGGVTSSSASYTFTLQSDRNLVANFIRDSFPGVSGSYNGLFRDETNGVTPQNCGCFTMTVTAKGAFTGSLQMGGTRYALSGQFDPTGAASETIVRRNANGLRVNLQLDLAGGTDRVTGSVSDGTWTAALAGDRALYDGRTKLAPEAGSYTLIIAGSYGSTNEPAGDSYGTLTVSRSGGVSFAGTLADGTTITPSAPVSKYGQWPLYASLYGGQGVLWGWLTFTNGADVGGTAAWTKQPMKTQYYPAGFSLSAQTLGARYFAPARGTNVLGLATSTNLTLMLDGGEMVQGITNRIALAANSHVSTVSGPRLTLTFTPTTGAFSGSVVNPATARPVSFGGVGLQKQMVGRGCFMGTAQSGAVLLEP
jgi:PKD repeat protein